MRFLNSILQNLIKSESDKRKLITVIVPSFIVQSFSVILSFGISILLARGLGAADYGIFTYVFAIVLMAVNLSSYGMNILVVRETPAFLSTGKLQLLKGFLKWASATVALSSTLLAVILIVLTYYFHIMPAETYITPMIIAAIAIPFYGMLNFYTSFLRGLNKIVLSLLNESIIKHITFFIAVLALYIFVRKMALIDVIYLNIITFGISFFVAMAIYYSKSTKFKKDTPQYDLKIWWAKLGSLFLLNGLIGIESRIDIIMLGYLKKSSDVGIFTASSKIAAFLSFFLMTMNFIIGPLVSKMNALEEKQLLQKMITKSIRWVMLFTLPFFLVIVLLSKTILHIFFGSDFEQGQFALVILCFAQLISILFGPVGNIITMTGNEKYFSLFTFLSMLLTIGLNFLLIPSMGYNGAAIATASSVLFWNASLYIVTKKKLGISAWIFG